MTLYFSALAFLLAFCSGHAQAYNYITGEWFYRYMRFVLAAGSLLALRMMVTP